MELDKDATTQLGFTWPSQINITEMGSPGIPVTGAVSVTQGATPSTTFTTTPGQTNWGQLFRVLDVSRQAFTLTLDALQRDGKARILSRPRLACQSGKEAELLVGGEKPTFTTDVASAGGTGTSVEYKEYGIKLRIKPTVTDDFRIKVSLNVEISEVGEAETIGTTTSVTAKAYPLSKRNISTEMYLNDGQTLSIGGLIKQKEEQQNQSVPFLGKLPILGPLFRSKLTSSGGGAGNRGDTELFITLTPTLINNRPMEQAAKIEVPVAAAPAAQPATPGYDMPDNI
ncbi:MAG: type II and III secretion system protein, partial [Candidatus Omnitrophica bacterium]|nr:type II and III secretion system protein [Candidatus Omnitrophota bacterium]